MRAIETTIDATLRRAEVDLALDPMADPPPLPTPQQVHDVLVQHRLLDIHHNYVHVNRLGMAVARGGLPLSAAEDLQHIATSAEEGASKLELLFEAARSDFIRDTVQWVALPEYWISVIDQVLHYAQAYRSEDSTADAVNSQDIDRRLGIARCWQRPEGPRVLRTGF
ncbi:hypothetical protein [Streptomyces sp. WAC00263]|uniref:hypothetical protein n=1 Tax=Streptomyces sp. WAC00263 TaxID=1917422 RepID=UPI0015EEEA70|nr:hypothetical protein [Streptomyces sp. WAC00263]